jgi:hypothetical protein
MSTFVEERPVAATVDPAELEAMYALDSAVEPTYEGATQPAPIDGAPDERGIGDRARDAVNGAHFKTFVEGRDRRRAALAEARAAAEADPTLANRLRYARRFATSLGIVVVGGIIVSKLAPGIGDFLNGDVDTSAAHGTGGETIAEAPALDLVAQTTEVAGVQPEEGLSLETVLLVASHTAAEVVTSSQHMVHGLDPHTVDPNVDHHVELPKWNADTGEGSIWFDVTHEWADAHGYDHLTEGQKMGIVGDVLDLQEGGLDDGKGMTWDEARHIDDYTRPSDNELFGVFDAHGAKHNAADAAPGTAPHPGDQVVVPPPKTGDQNPPPPGGNEGGDSGAGPDTEGWWERNWGKVLAASLIGAAAIAGIAALARRRDRPVIVEEEEVVEGEVGDPPAARRRTATRVVAPGDRLYVDPDDEEEQRRRATV